MIIFLRELTHGNPSEIYILTAATSVNIWIKSKICVRYQLTLVKGTFDEFEFGLSPNISVYNCWVGMGMPVCSLTRFSSSIGWYAEPLVRFEVMQSR